jgi:hypothetical protein
VNDAVDGEEPVDGVFILLVPEFLEPGANNGIRRHGSIGHEQLLWRPKAYRKRPNSRHEF